MKNSVRIANKVLMQDRIEEYAKAYILEAIEYYNSLIEGNIDNPIKREMYLQWSQAKQQELIDIQEFIESHRE